MRRALVWGGVIVLAFFTAAASPGAVVGQKPSAGTPLQYGVPYSATLTLHGGPYEWLTSPELFLPGDRLQLAVDSDGGPLGGANLRVCLVPATDDFGQKDTENGCDGPGYTSDYEYFDVSKGKFRRTLSWTSAKSKGFVIVGAGCGACGTKTDTFSIILEKHIHAVRLGTLAVKHAGQAWRASVATLLTDNTNVPNGHKGTLEVAYNGGKPKIVSHATTKGGRLTFAFRVPSKTRSAVARACTTLVGSGDRVCSVRSTLRF